MARDVSSPTALCTRVDRSEFNSDEEGCIKNYVQIM